MSTSTKTIEITVSPEGAVRIKTVGFDLGLLDGVSLQELVQPGLLAPVAAVVVVLEGAGLKIGDDRV